MFDWLGNPVYHNSELLEVSTPSNSDSESESNSEYSDENSISSSQNSLSLELNNDQNSNLSNFKSVSSCEHIVDHCFMCGENKMLKEKIEIINNIPGFLFDVLSINYKKTKNPEWVCDACTMTKLLKLAYRPGVKYDMRREKRTKIRINTFSYETPFKIL